MRSERFQRRIDAAFDEADAALDSRDWPTVLERAEFILTLDPSNQDAFTFREAALRAEGSAGLPPAAGPPVAPARPATEQPASFADGRYEVRRFLGEGGKKRVFLGWDSPEAIRAAAREQLEATGGFPFQDEDPHGYLNGDIGWFCDRPSMRMGEDMVVPMRMSRVARKVDGN